MDDNSVMTTGVDTPTPVASDNKVNDWVVASLMNPQTTYAGFQQQGITPDNTALKGKSYYESNDNIKKIFTNKQGEFDQGQFDKFYDINVATFNQFSNKAFNQTIIDNAPTYYKDQLRKPKDAEVMNQQSLIQEVSNPFKKKTGFDGFGVISDPTFSIRDLAQQNQVKDSTTGKDLGWTPNDDDKRGLFDFWFTPTTVLAQYDTDGDHYDPMEGRKVKHKKGDYKTNETGDFYYETLGDRESYGKQVLSVWDTNTVAGTFANKFDFMNSDGLNKSFTGSVVKTAAQIIPYFIPGVGEVYGGMTIGLALAEALPAVAKGITGIFVNDAQKDTSYYKAMNDVQGFAKRFTSGGSDASKTSSFNTENVLQMVSDTFGMLYLQKNLAAIPQLLGASAKEARMVSQAAKDSPKMAAWLKETLTGAEQTAKAAGKDFAGIQEAKDALYYKAIQMNPNLAKVFESATKWTNTASMGLSTAYLSATMSMGVVEKAKELGLDERDTGALLLGTMAGLSAFITYAPIGHWVMEGLGLDEIGVAAKQSIKTEGDILQKSLQDIDDAIVQRTAIEGTSAETAKISKINKIFAKGKEFGKLIGAKFNDTSYLGKALAEGTFMITQDAMMDSLRVGYNALNALGLTSTNDPNKDFEFTPQDMFQRYAMSFFGGALGGVMFMGHDRIMAKMTSATGEQDKKDMFYFVRNEMKDQYLAAIDAQEKKGTLGNRSLSPLVYDTNNNITDTPLYKPAETAAQSQNSIVANMLRGQVEYLDRIVKQEGLMSDKDIEQVYEQRYKTAIDLKLNTAIRDDVQQLSSDVINKVNDIKSLIIPEKEATDFERNEYHTKVNKLNSELLYMKEQMRVIADGEKYAQYFSEALFNMNDKINGPFGIKTKNDFAIATYGKSQWELDDVQKQAIEDKYTVFKQYEKRQQLRVGKELFDQTHDETNKWIPSLASYADQKQGYFNNYVDVNATLNKLQVNEQNVDQVDTRTADLDSFVTDKPQESNIDYLLRVVDTQKYIHPEITGKLLDEFSNMKADSFLASNGTTTQGALYDIMDANGHSDVAADIESNFDLPDHVGFEKLATIDVGNVDKVVNEMKQHLDENKDLIDQYATEPDTVQAIKQSLDGLKGYLSQINPEFAEYNRKAEFLLSKLKSKEKSPLYDLLKKTAVKVEGASISNVLDVIQSEFKNLSEREDASKFVLDNNIKYDQLAQAKDLIGKLQASIRASASFSYTDEPFGYNLAINRVKEAMGDKVLYNNLSLDQFYTLDKELQILAAKVDFLTNLSRINEGSKVKNMKLGSGVMRGLFADAIGPDSEILPILEKAGVDTTEIKAAYANASNLANWIGIIRDSENKLPLPSKDQDLIDLEKETAQIERTFYDAINADPSNKHNLLNRIQHGFDLSKLVLSHDKKTNFYHTAKSVTYYDSYMYLNTIANVDGAEFLNDFRGAQDEQGVFDLEKSKYAPFFGQEYALKQAYWLMQSQSEGINSVNMALSRMSVPGELKTDEEKQVFGNSLTKTLYNTIFINGIPGSGKTTGILNYLSRMARKYGYDVAAYGPHQEQGENLRESIGSVANVINSDMHVKGLLHTIMPNGLYERIQQQIEDQGWDTNKVDRENPSTYKSDKLIVLDTLGDGKGYDIRLNPHHPDIAEFLSGDKLSSITVEGKPINMIFIDEATHLSAIDLQILNEGIRVHNDKNNNKIGLFLTGDSEQRGYTMEFPELSKGNIVNINVNMFTLFKTPTLSESLRTGFNIKSKNIDIIRAYRQQYDNIISTSGDANLSANVKNYIADERIQLEFTEENDQLIGDKLVDSIEKADIDKLLANIGLDKNGKANKIGIIVSNLEGPLTRLVKSYPDWENKFDIKTPDRVQGLEYEAVAIDVDPTVIGNDNVNSAIRALEMLYTMTTRSKKASIIDNKIIQGMNLESTDKDIFAVKTQLDAGVVESYKKFRLESIKFTLESLGDKSQFNTKSVIVAKPLPLKTRTLTTSPEEEDKFFNLVLGGNVEPPVDSTTDSAGNITPIEVTRQKLVLYPYHERLQILSDVNNKIVDTKGDTKDLSLFYKILNPDSSVKGKMLDNEEVMEARRNLKVFKNALYNYSNYIANPENRLPLEDYFRKYTNLHPDIIDSINFDNIKLGVESKYYIPNADSDKGAVARRENSGGIAHFQIAKIELKDGTIGEVTLAAFPSPYNPLVNGKSDVMQVMNELAQRFNDTKLEAKGGEDFALFTPYKSGLEVSDIAKPYNNLEVRSGVNMSLEQMMKENPHLKFSNVHILSNAKMFDQGEDQNVDLAIKNLVGDNSNRDNKVNKYSAKLLGRAVVFVTYDTTKAESVLSQDFQSQFIDSIRSKNDPTKRETKDTVKMIPLNTKGLTLTEWIDKNKEIAYGLKDANLDSKVQKLAYGNKYLAARILNSIYNTDLFIKQQIQKGNFEGIRKSLRLDPRYTDEVIRDMSAKNTSLLTDVLHILGTTDNAITLREPGSGVLAAIAKNYYSEIIAEAGDEAQGINKAFPKAAGHYYTKQLVDAIQANMKPNGFVVDNSILRTLEDKDGNSMYLEFQHSEPFNVLIALRAALEGGRWKTKEGQRAFSGMFPESSIEGKKNYYDFLDKMLGKEFPDGLYINPVIRKATEENQLPDGLLAYPAGNPTSHFTIDAKINEFKSLFNIDDLELRKPEDVERSVEEHKQIINSSMLDVKNMLDQDISPNVSSGMDTDIVNHYNQYTRGIYNNPDPEYIKAAADNISATRNKLLEGVKAIIDKGTSKNKLIDAKNGLTIIKNVDISDGHTIKLESTPYETALERQINDIATSNGIPSEDITVVDSGISKDTPIEYIVKNNKTDERIAKFAFSEGEFKNVVLTTPDEHLGVIKDTAYNNLSSLNGDLLQSVHDFIREDVGEFFNHIDNIKALGATSSVDLDTQLKLGSKYLMISASLTGNNKSQLLESFNEAYKDFIEHYKC